MPHPIHRVTRFEIIGPYTLSVTFTDGTQQQIDFRPVLHGALFGPLQDPATFNAVVLDQEVGTLAWPNGADFDPATLHGWPLVRDEFEERAHAWAQSAPNEAQAGMRLKPSRQTVLCDHVATARG